MKINNFEDMEVWQEARELARFIFKITSEEPFVRDYKFRDQIRAAAGSIMDNVAEGFGRGGTREFNNFLSIAKGSNEEVRSQSYRAFDFEYISEEVLKELLEKTDKLSRKIQSFMNYLKNAPYRGTKFKQ